MPARGAGSSESEVTKSKKAVTKDAVPGINRSGKKRDGQQAAFESSQEPTQKQALPGNNLVGPADNLESDLPVQPVLAAEICDEILNCPLSGISNSLNNFEEIQSDQDRDAAELVLVSDNSIESVETSDR